MSVSPIHESVAPDIPRPWLAEYPPGVPAQADIHRYRSLVEVVDQCCQRYADLPAYRMLTSTLRFADIDRLSRQFAGFLLQSGLKQGDRVAIMLPNVFAYPVALFGVLRAGLTVVNVNPLYTPHELTHILRDAGARTVVSLHQFAQVFAKLEPGLIDTLVLATPGDLHGFLRRTAINFVTRSLFMTDANCKARRVVAFADALKHGDVRLRPAVPVQRTDVAFLQYTGGTTGVVKGAMLTHGNMVSNLMQATAWFQGHLQEGSEVIITALPLYHVFALLANALLFMVLGGLCVLIPNPRDLPAFIKELRRNRFTCLTGVNTLFNALMHAPGFEQCDFSRLKLVLGGGMAVQRAVAERWHQATGCPITEAYGLTETSPAACINRPDLKAYSGSAGLPVPSTDFSIQDDAGTLLPIGETGEICIRGPQVMAGYWRQPEETARVLGADGWLHTGDIGRLDTSGRVYIVDRKKDMILVSGFNVYPNEIEDVAVAHPGVLEAAAIGIPDERSGEVPVLFVVRKDPALNVAELQRHLEANLTHYKLPRRIEFRDSLPKSNVGKVLRRKLREELMPVDKPR